MDKSDKSAPAPKDLSPAPKDLSSDVPHLLSTLREVFFGTGDHLLSYCRTRFEYLHK